MYAMFVYKQLVVRAVLLLVILAGSRGSDVVHCSEKCRCVYNHGTEATCTGLTASETLQALESLPNNTVELKLIRSTLTYFPRSQIARFTDLSHLTITDGSLETLSPGDFDSLTELDKLNLSSNIIRSLPDDLFRSMTRVSQIYLQNNAISEISKSTFESFSAKLKLMDLSHNKLTTEVANNLKRGITDAKYPLKLFLANNVITNIPDFPLSKLSYLNLENNRISTLDSEVEYSITEMLSTESRRVIHLHGNPFYCNCHLAWFISLFHGLRPHHQPVIPSCTGPPRFANRSMSDVNVSALTCDCPVGEVAGGSFGCTLECPLNSVNVSYKCTCLAGFTSPTSFTRENTSTAGCECNAVLLHGPCQACPENTFKGHIGNDACLPCPVNSLSIIGTANITGCKCMSGASSIWSSNGSMFSCAQELQAVGLKEEQQDFPFVAAIVGGVLSLSVVLTVAFIYCRWRNWRCPCKGELNVYTTPHQSRTPRAQQDNILYEGFRQHLINETELNTEVHYAPSTAFHTNLPPLKFQQEIDKWELPRESLKIGHLLGEGAFGMVYEGWAQSRDTSEPVKVAVKTVRDGATREEALSLRLEMEQLIFVGRHPNVINLLGTCTKGDRILVVLEYAKHGNLLNFLRNKALDVSRNGMTGNTVSKDLLMFAWHIAKGMSHLETMKCLHRDLAARNILICENMVAKLCDFGLSRDAYESGYYKKQSQERVPFKWMSIESLLNGRYTSKSDVWSYGIVLWEIATLGGTPYPAISAKTLFDVLKTGYRMPKPDLCNDNMYDIMTSCWHEKPDERPTFHELCETLDIHIQEHSNQHYLELQDPQLNPACKDKTATGHTNETHGHLEG